MTAPYTVERLAWRDVPLREIAYPGGVLRLTLGLGSGLSCDGAGRIWAIADRGPNLKVREAAARHGLAHLAPLGVRAGAKIMPAPDLGPVLCGLRVTGDTVELVEPLPLRTPGGRPVSGLPPAGALAQMEPAFDDAGRLLAPDPDGADAEAVAALSDGTFWVAEEYGPSLMRVDEGGVVRARWRPGAPLPAIMARRRLNRGFEAIALSADETRLYVMMQSALEDEPADIVRLWTLDAATGALIAEHRYPFDPPESFARDAALGPVSAADLKICDLAPMADGALLVLERISAAAKLYRVDPDAARGVLEKRLLLTTDEAVEIAPDLEGATWLSPDTLLLATDNDFGVEGRETAFFRVRFGG